MRQSLRISMLVLCSAVAACRADRPEIIIDDWGTSGYARIEGTVTRADGTPVAGTSLFFMCGQDEPDQFGWSPSTHTDAMGRFAFDIDAPGPVLLPAGGALNCRVLAPHDAPAIASVTQAVRFSDTAGARPLTIVNLVAP